MFLKIPTRNNIAIHIGKICLVQDYTTDTNLGMFWKNEIQYLSRLYVVFIKKCRKVLKITTLNIIFEEISHSYIHNFYMKAQFGKLAKWFFDMLKVPAQK